MLISRGSASDSGGAAITYRYNVIMVPRRTTLDPVANNKMYNYRNEYRRLCLLELVNHSDPSPSTATHIFKYR